MGKVTGFLEFERLEEGYEPVEKRVKNYKEFVIGLTAEQAAQHSKNALDQAERHLTNLLEKRDRIDNARRREQESQEARNIPSAKKE